MARLAAMLFTLLLLVSIPLPAQQAQVPPPATLDDVRAAYEEFDYAKVIALSSTALFNPGTLSQTERISLLTLRGVSQYNLGEEDSARATILGILSLDPSFTLDPVRFSPKIVDFVGQVRKSFSPAQRPDPPQSADTMLISSPRVVPPALSMNSVIAKSIVLPGWGHLSAGATTKGWLLTAASAATIASSIYFIARANRLERQYLAETDRTAMDQKFSDYNSAYKLRNIMLGSYAVVWTAAQLDILFLSDQPFSTSLIVEARRGPASVFYPAFAASISF